MTCRIIRITECRQCPYHMAGVNECALVGYGTTGHECDLPIHGHTRLVPPGAGERHAQRQPICPQIDQSLVEEIESEVRR